MAELPPPPSYKRPPIVERVITAYTVMEAEEFQAKEPSWKSKAILGFPFFNPVVQWDLNIENKEGVPMLTEKGPQMRIHDWFFEHPKKESRGFALQSDEGKFGVNLLKDKDNAFRFRDVELKFKEWLPKWADHFGVTTFTGFALDYVNLLNNTTIPEFVSGGSINIGEVFKLFNNIPGPHISLTPPYDCQVNLLLNKEMPAAGRIQIREAGLDGLRLEMQMRSTGTTEKKVTIEQGLAEVLALHEWMITYFEALFTDKAKKTFEPIQ